MILALAIWVVGSQANAQTPGLSIHLNAGYPSLSITGTVTSCYAVQYVGNLSRTNHWQLLTNLVLAANPCVLADTNVPDGGQRFYRTMLTNINIRVAVFSDPNGGSTDSGCVSSTVSILSTNSGITVSTISPASVIAGGLSNYDVVMFPGGSGTLEAEAIGQTGCANVAQFVAKGGGYIGTCAGAYLGVLKYNPSISYWLGIVNAQIIDYAHWARGEGTAEVRLVNTNNVILAGFGQYIYAHYDNGPLLEPGGSTGLPVYEQDAVYVSDIYGGDGSVAGVMPGTTAMTTSTYQSGKCVLFSFHPELTPGLEQLDVRAVKWSAGRL